MTARSYFRGHPTHWDEHEQCWRYSDDGSLAGFRDANGEIQAAGSVRPCARCGRWFQGSNHGEPDPCLGVLPGVDNACCGHGVREKAYIRFTSGVLIKGFDVIEHTPAWRGEGD